MNTTKNKPCLVNTGQGFSVLYDNKFLFSKYNPQRSIRRIIDSLDIRAGTLFLLCSPVLHFPITLLQNKLATCSLEVQKSCCALLVEHDKILYDFSLDHIHYSHYLLATNPRDITLFIHKAQKNQIFPAEGILKRIVKIDCSATCQNSTTFYTNALRYADDLIAGFWKNRMTLTHLGKLFTSNSLKNISLLDKSTLLKKHSVNKPILVFGAGCSLDITVAQLINSFTTQILSRKSIYIIAVDVTIIPLLQRGIVPNAVISLESQLAIEQAYIGMQDLLKKAYKCCPISGNPKSIHYICDISSRNAVARYFNNQEHTISFFMSKYCSDPFMARLEQTNCIQPVIQPLGSVGVGAVEIATYLRNADTPIYVTGIDFSYPAETTHCASAPSPQKIMRTHNRLHPIGSPDAAYKKGAIQISKNCFSDTALSGYGRLFVEHFSATKNLYNLAKTGYPLALQHATIEDIVTAVNSPLSKSELLNVNISRPQIEQTGQFTQNKLVANHFYKAEQDRLVLIKQILTQKPQKKLKTAHSSSTTPQESQKAKLLSLIDECSYLYLHFPDGYKKARLEQDFLNRVRAGIDYYLKLCKQRD